MAVVVAVAVVAATLSELLNIFQVLGGGGPSTSDFGRVRGCVVFLGSARKTIEHIGRWVAW